MAGIQAHLRSLPYTPRHYVSFLGIVLEAMGGVVMCAIQGAVLAMLGFIGLGMARSSIGTVILPELLHIPVKWFSAILPLSLAPYAGTLCLAGLFGLLGTTFIHAAWTRTLTSSFMAPSEESNNMLYGVLAYVLPLGLLAFSLNTGVLATSTAFWFAASTSAVASSYWILVMPTQQNWVLWNAQKAKHEREATRLAEATSAEAPRANATRVDAPASSTPASAAAPSPSPTSARAMTPRFNHSRHSRHSRRSLADSASRGSGIEIVGDADALDDTNVGPPSP